MSKILFKFLIILYFFSTSVFADSIDKVTVIGNKRISQETIKILGNISTNKKVIR